MHCELPFWQWDYIVVVWQEENTIEIKYTNNIIMGGTPSMPRATTKYELKPHRREDHC